MQVATGSCCGTGPQYLASAHLHFRVQHAMLWRASAGKETGNSKFKNAEEKKTQLLTEGGLLALVKASVPFLEDEAAEAASEDDVMEVDPPKLDAGTASKAATSKAGSSKASTAKAADIAAARKAAEAPVDPSAILRMSVWMLCIGSLVGIAYVLYSCLQEGRCVCFLSANKPESVPWPFQVRGPVLLGAGQALRRWSFL